MNRQKSNSRTYTSGISLRSNISSSSIRKAAKRCETITELAYLSGYSCPQNLGSNSMNRIKRDIGDSCYYEIASGYRKNSPRKTWTNPISV